MTPMTNPVADTYSLELEKIPDVATLLEAEENNSQITASDDYGAGITATQHPPADRNYAVNERRGKI